MNEWNGLKALVDSLVRSFGTEERPTDHPAPPRDETYDFIVFRGADIRYIDVVEPPKKTTTSKDGIPIPIDPAIVEVSHQVSPLSRIQFLLK